MPPGFFGMRSVPGGQPGKIVVAIILGQTGVGGGSEKQLLHLLGGRDRSRMDYHVIALNTVEPYAVDRAIEDLGVPLMHLPPECLSHGQRMTELLRCVSSLRPHVLHSWSFHANPYAGLVGRLCRVPVTLGSLRSDPDSKGILRMGPISRWLAFHATHGIVVNSRNALGILVEGGHQEQRLHFVRNAVMGPDGDATGAAWRGLEEFGIPKGNRLIGAVGHLRSGKNYEMFIDAAAHVMARVADVTAVIIGREAPEEPQLRSRLQERIDSLGLGGRICLTGPRADVPSLLKSLSVLCFTSRSEGMPNAVLEAMAAGCPVISTPVGDVSAVIRDGETGLLVRHDDAKMLADLTLGLLENPAKASRLASSGRSFVLSHHSCSAMVHEMETLYMSSVLARPVRSGVADDS